MDISSGEISFLVFRRVDRQDMGEFSLDGLMLSILMELDGKKSLAAVAKKISLNMGAMRETISRLMDLGLIEPVEGAVSTLDQEFLNYMRRELSLAVGPIAQVIIEDGAIDLGHDLSRFPTHLAAELVDLAAREIQKEDKRGVFQRNMLNKIKAKGY